MKPAGLLAVALALAAGGPARTAEPFDPVAFFTGATESHGTLKELFGKSKKTTAESFGRVEADGWMVLDQKVTVEGSPVRQQKWRLRETSPGHYSGTLTSADGPVDIQTVGSSIRIRYRMKDGIKVDQMLTPVAGGQAINNRSTFHKWGMKVATLTERIEKR